MEDSHRSVGKETDYCVRIGVSILVLMEDSHRLEPAEDWGRRPSSVSILVLMEDSHRYNDRHVAGTVLNEFQSLF